MRRHFTDIAEGKVTTYKGWDEMKDFDSFPADAQLGIMVLSWAALKREWDFTKAVARRDWRTAARESALEEFTRERKAALNRMFINAAAVDDFARAGSRMYNLTTLYYPAALTPASRDAVKFQIAVEARDWELAYKRLNFLGMTEMLRAIKRLYKEDREIMWGVRDHLKAQNLPVNWKRLEFAFTVVRERRIPIYSMIPSIEMADGVWTDEHWGIHPDQVVDALRFLGRG